MKKKFIKKYAQDMTNALLEPLGHCSKENEKIVFKSVLSSIVHFAKVYNWIVGIDSDIITGSIFEPMALSELFAQNLFETFFTNISVVILQLFERLPDAIEESFNNNFMWVEFNNSIEENSLPADILE